jgi:hypothetical protein
MNEATKTQKPWISKESIDKINQKYGLQLQWQDRPPKTQNTTVGGRRRSTKKLKRSKRVRGKSHKTRR